MFRVYMLINIYYCKNMLSFTLYDKPALFHASLSPTPFQIKY